MGLCFFSRHFSASNGWFARFQNEHQYSCQRARTVRRPIPTIKSSYIKYVFLDAIKEVFETYPRNLILNMDEMNAGQGHDHFFSLGHRNSGSRRIDCQYDNKTLLTACITITAEGYALPTCYLRKGKTRRCLEQLQLTGSEEGFSSASLSLRLSLVQLFTSNVVCVGCPTASGWSTSCAMLYYMEHVVLKYTQK